MKIKTVLIICFIAVQSFAQILNYQVNAPNAAGPNEPTIAINPVNPSILAAGSNLNYSYRSTDGGKTWAQKSLSSTLGVWGDPCVVFDTEGNLLFGHLSNPPEGFWIDRIVVQRSIDNGLTFSDGAGIGFSGFSDQRNQDKEWIAVDHTNSQYRNNVYMSWTEFDSYGSGSSTDSSRILFSRSSSGGVYWSRPVNISDTGGDCVDSDLTVEGAVPAVGPNGEVYISWVGPLGIMFDKSLNGGMTFGKDIFVSDVPGGWDFAVPGIYRCNGLPITAADISNSHYRGNVYIMWGDQRNGADDTDVFFKRSTDQGETWSETVRVNNDLKTRQQFFPWMTVDSVTGNIYAVFYDRRNTVGVDTEVYIARSTDGGESFENFVISESPFTPTSGYFFGDYNNISAYNGMVHPIWERMHDGVYSIMTAAIHDSMLVTSADEEIQDVPSEYILMQNYPNPFNGQTTIGYIIPEDAHVKVELFNVIGERVKTLLDEEISFGYHELSISSDDLISGVYLYSILANEFWAQKKMIVLK